jgi:hypothetical protein
MKHAKLAKRSGHKLPAGQFQSLAERDGTDAARLPDQKAARKKTVPSKVKPAQSLRKEMVRKAKSDKLVCRYCGSDNLAPSFIKRRDRRCRKCFSKRYGSAARARKSRIKK